MSGAIPAETEQVELLPVLHFNVAQVAQIFRPATHLMQQLGNCIRQKNMAGISRCHDPLGEVDATARDVGMSIDIGDTMDRAAVEAHAEPHLGDFARGSGDIEGTADGRFGIAKKYQRNAVPGG
jgi:hypothetical protein